MRINYLIKKIQYLILKPYFNYPKTLVEYFDKNKDKTIVSFSSIGRGRKFTQKNEFFHLTQKFNVLFVKDVTRSWFNNLDVKYIKQYLKKDVYTIGFSMGAFNAIIFSCLFPVKKVIAFSPQFSINPNISEDETFLNYAAKINRWKFKKIKFSNKTKYLLVFGDSEKEKYHMSKIPKKKNIKFLTIKNCDHNTALRLKKDKKLKNLIDNFLD